MGGCMGAAAGTTTRRAGTTLACPRGRAVDAGARLGARGAGARTHARASTTRRLRVNSSQDDAATRRMRSSSLRAPADGDDVAPDDAPASFRMAGRARVSS